MTMRLLRKLTAAGPSELSAFPILGWGGKELWYRFQALPGVRTSQTPGDADLVVLAGVIPPQWRSRLQALLDSFALPRAVLVLQPSWMEPDEPTLGVSLCVPEGIIGHLDVERLRDALVAASSSAEPWQLEPAPPGSAPQFPRPLAMMIEGALPANGEVVPAVVGPHFPYLPSGLQLELRLEGDLIHRCDGIHNAFPLSAFGGAERRVGAGNLPALAVLQGRLVSLAEMEEARLYSHLCWMADFLVLAGRGSIAEEIRKRRHDIDGPSLEALIHQAERGLRRQLDGVGHIDAAGVRRYQLRGPVARASGIELDTRSADPNYLSIGFEPQVETGGDAWARWRVRVREARHSLELIERAGARFAESAEGPRGALAAGAGQLVAPTSPCFFVLRSGLRGLEWSQALLFIGSLDLSMEEAALQ